ncbi:TPA: chitobiase/beta-hexosaminidase C-terminal domain-containing protein, partial [Listeria monocytogenes]|nr:chitobiase/beta-hexosaminidase C-terminal domain-containing protein [Listeria monocytogenes]
GGSSGLGNGTLEFATLAELQTAYPNGVDQFVWITSTNSWYFWDNGGFTNGSTGGSLVYPTLSELQSALPGGSTSPVWITDQKSWFYWDGATGGSATDTVAPVVTVSPAGGTFNSAQSVTLSANEPATIYYTLNGSTPTTSSSVYSTAISISAATTLKYFAMDPAGNTSAVQTQTYTISSGTTQFLLASQSQTISYSSNVGTRGGGVHVKVNTTITGVGAKGGASGNWSLWKLDPVTYNITQQLASGSAVS